ncbi:unnamed protein product [Psylliodes chrysocephalus]|uniref:Uncharacterized protein n=1 Tax=Psylliodes chrysocephalus TaxID=3402493 RepID=A0A9P0CMQ1_9CUCU|nr:unnamed protein product [Psylliodes chrysocephala]
MCQTNQLTEENNKLLKELQRVREMNENLLSTIDGLKRLHVARKSECKCEANKLSEENKKLLKELQRVREMNENLLSTIDGLRTQLHVASKVTSEEVIKLNKTVDVLQKALERGKLLHEEEEQEKKNENKKLRSTIKELESCICGCEQQIQNKSAEISKQHRNIQELEKCVCTLQNQLQIKHGDISTLSNRIKELERYGNDVEQESSKASKDVDVLKSRIKELENYTLELQSKGKLCKICKQNVRVSFTDCSEVQTDGREPTHEQLELLLNRDELIKYQSSTLEKMQQELQNVCEREKELLAEKQTYCKENCSLQNKLLILERKLNEAERTAQEISNKEEIIKKQKEALNLLQRETECLRTAEAEMRTKNQECCACIQQLKNKVNELEISVENAEKRGNNLQTAEELQICKSNIKKLQKQKRNFEKVVGYFKEEMATMSQQLQNLQDLLNMSHESSQKEANKLMESLVNLQQLNQKLSLQLAAAEQKVILENQMNQLNQTKISELERMIAEKDVDLHKHTSTIETIKKSLQSSLQQNKELQQTISSLNQTIMEFQEIVRKYEEDNNKSKENTTLCKTQIGVCKDKLLELNVILERKTTELCTLECAYNQQHKSLKSCQIELNKFKEKQKTKQQYLKRVIEQLKIQLSAAQDAHKKVVERHNAVEKELDAIKCKDSAKDDEVDKYKKFVGELKVTLVELNDSLINQECRCQDEDSPDQSTNNSFEDASSCSCEMGYYLGIIESVKKATIQLMTNLSDSQKQNVKLEKENKHKQSQIEEMAKAQLERDKKYNELKQKLMDILKHSQAEEQHYIELTKTLHKEINLLKNDLEHKIKQFKEAERNAEEVASSISMELAAANEEVELLKEQLNNLVRQQRVVNSQNDQLQNQNEFLESKVATLEETGGSLRTQLEQYLVDIQKFQRDNETLQQKNHDLLCELRSLHASFEAVTSQKRDKQSIPCERMYAKPKNMSHLTCQGPCSLGSQGNDNESIYSISPVHSPCPPCPNRRQVDDCDWFADTYKNDSDSDEEVEEDWVSKVECLADQVKKTHKMWKHKMEKSDYTVTKDSKK